MAIPSASFGQYAPPPIRGSVDTLYTYSEDEENSVDTLTQQWNLQWEDLMPNGDRLGLDFAGSWQRSSEQEGTDWYPSIGAVLKAEDYLLRTRYSRFIDRGLLGGDGKQTQQRWEVDLVLLRLLFDEIRLYMDEDWVKDDFDPHLTDVETRQRQIGFAHEFNDLTFLETLNISGQHWEEEFKNNAAPDVRIPFIQPTAITVDGANVYVADSALGQVIVLTTSLTFIRTVGDGLSGVGRLQEPRGVAVDSQRRVYVSDARRHQIFRFRENGIFDQSWGTGAGSAPGQFNRPSELAVGPDGTVYVADSGNRRIQRLLPGSPEFEVLISGGLVEPLGVDVDRQGRIFVADRSLNRVSRYSAAGALEVSWGVAGSGPGGFNAPTSVAVDDNLFVYVADTNNSRIQKFTDSGNFITQWGNDPSSETLRFPEGVARGGAFIYVSDTGNGLVRKYDTGGGLVQSSLGARLTDRKTTDDSFSTDFSLSPTDWWRIFGSYQTHLLETENSDDSGTETWTNDASLQTTVELTDFWSVSGGGVLRYLESERRDALDTLPPTFRTDETEELDVTGFASTRVRLRRDMNLGISHTESRSFDDGDETSANRNSSAFLTTRPWADVFVDLRGSHVELETDGERTSNTDSAGYTVRGPLFDGTYLIASHDLSWAEVSAAAGDQEISTHVGRLEINSQIGRRTYGRLLYNYTHTTTQTEDEASTSDFHTAGLEVTQNMTPFVYVTGGVRHVLGDPGNVSEWLFTSSLGWRWGDRYNLLLTYTDFQDGTKSRNFSSRLTIRLRPRSRLDLTYENFDEERVGMTQSVTARLVVAF